MEEITVEKLTELTINDLNNLKAKDFKDKNSAVARTTTDKYKTNSLE